MDEIAQEYEEQIRNSAYLEQVRQAKEQYNYQRWLVDDQQEILDLQYSLRGIIWDEKEQSYLKDPKQETMSDAGARKLTDFFLRLISKGGKLSRYDDKEVKTVMRYTMKELTIHLFDSYARYNMQYNDMGIVLTTFENALYSILLRGKDGMEQERIMTTGKIISEERGNVSEKIPQQVYDHDAYMPQQTKKRFGVF